MRLVEPKTTVNMLTNLEQEKSQSEANRKDALAAPTGSEKTWTDEQLNWLLREIELNAKLKEADNKKLLWLAMNTAPWKSLDVMGVEAEIFGEIENRLYPEYDGETVTFEEWGWRTPTGDIRYLPNVRMSEGADK
jgi:hypothetical protein